MSNYNLVIFNAGDASRLQRPDKTKMVVDISICYAEIDNKFTWASHQDTFYLGHFPIILEFFTEFDYNDIVFPVLHRHQFF